MKKLKVICFLLISGIYISGCNSLASNPINNQENDKPVAMKEMNVQGIYNDTLIEEIYHEAGTYIDGDGYSYDYQYSLPKLKSDSLDATRINQEIEAQFGEMIEEEKRCRTHKQSLFYDEVSWDSYWNDSLLSLVITAKSNHDYVEYGVYNFDFDTGKVLNQQDLLKRCQLTEETFMKGIREAAVQCYDELFDQMTLDMRSSCGYLETRQWTISDENLNSTLMMYLDENQKLNVITPIGSIAGGSWYYYTLKPEFDKKEIVKKKCQSNDITAVLEKNEVTITYKAKDNGQKKTCKVNGLYDVYSDLFCGHIGAEENLYLFLITKNQKVEVINVCEGLKSNYFCSMGQITGLSDIRSFNEREEREGENSYRTVIAKDSKGKEYDLLTPVLQIENTLPGGLLGTWVTQVTHHVASGGSYESEYFWQFDEDNTVTYTDNVYEAEVYLEKYGYFTYLGMTEEGLIFAYSLGDEEGRAEGIFAIKVDYKQLTFKRLGGQDLLDVPQAEQITFMRSYG